MLIFFDFDGTLSAPRFPKPGTDGREFVCGLKEAEWKNYHETHRETTFAYALPVGPVRRYAMQKKQEGHRLFVLTRTISESENVGKKAFLQKHYPGIFEEYISVNHDSDKIPVIRDMAEHAQISLEECELVEDTYMLVLQALSSGMIGTHVSNIVADEEMKKVRIE